MAMEALLAFMFLACTVRGMPGKNHNTPRQFECWSTVYLLIRKCWQKNRRNNLYIPISTTKCEECSLSFHYLRLIIYFNALTTLLLPFISPAPWHPHQQFIAFDCWYCRKISVQEGVMPCHDTSCLAWSLAWSCCLARSFEHSSLC